MEEPASPDFPRIRPPARTGDCVVSTQRVCLVHRDRPGLDRPGLDKAWPGQAKGVLARPGTPRVPKNHLLVTKWVAIKDGEAA